MDATTLPTSSEPTEVLAWMADHPCLGDAIEAVIEARAHYRVLAWAVGYWESTQRPVQAAERVRQCLGG